MRSDAKSELNEAVQFERQFLKGFPPSITPFGKRKHIESVVFSIEKISVLSIQKVRL